MKRNSVLCLALVLGFSGSLRAERSLMAALGDSITAATFANKSLTRDQDLIVPDLGEVPLIDALIPFLGNRENKDSYSWASGRSIPSHFLRLKKALGAQTELEVLNVAVPGNTTVNLKQQVAEIARAMGTGRYTSLKYVTVMMGANDVCGKATPQQIRQNIEKALEGLAPFAARDKVRVLVSGLPKIPDLGKPHIRNLRSVAGLSCSFVRDRILGFCPGMMSWSSKGEYEQKIKFTLERNRAIQGAVDFSRGRYRNLEIVFSNKFYETDILPDYLAPDCFHPNAKGQSLIAEKMWADQPWF